ncbi:MAG TPA: GNAT family N-acetyltransferase [Solirubrobacteraceae bacterium]
MRFELTRDPSEFAARAGGYIEERIECNVLGTVSQNILEGRHPSALFGYGLDHRGDVRFAALRTPPWFLLASELDEQHARDFVELWLEADPEVPGVNGVPRTAQAIAAGWAARTGGSTECRMRDAMHSLEEVRDPPRPAHGQLRVAHHDERALLIGWMRAFAHEAGVTGADQAEALVDAALRRDRLFVWNAEQPVSMVGCSPPIGAVVRIGPVYTPPEFRRHGYGGSAVAAISRRALAGEATKCMLFTDLANPTSNKIYAEVGYRPFANWEEHAFKPA